MEKTSTNTLNNTLDTSQLDPKLKLQKDYLIDFNNNPSDLIRKLEGLPKSLDIKRDVEDLYKPAQVIVDGFTPGSVKNILSIDGKELKVFSVTEDSIQLFSKSKLSLPAPPNRREEITLIFNPQTCSLVFYSNLKAPLKLIKLRRGTGDVEKVDDIDTYSLKKFGSLSRFAIFALKGLPSIKSHALGYLLEESGRRQN